MRTRLLLTLLGCVAAMPFLDPAAAAADGITKVTVTVVLMPGRLPVDGMLMRREKGEVTSLDDIDSSGTEQFDEADCSSETTYLVQPIGGRYTADGLWKGCRGDRPIPFTFYPKGAPRAAALATASLQSHGAGDRGTDFLPAQWADSADFAPALQQISAAYSNGEYGTAAVIDADLGERLKTVNLDAARGFKEAATIDALTAIMQQTGKSLDTPITYDPVNKLSVPTSNAEDLIKTYQASSQLPVSGKLDWVTIRSLSPQANEGLYEATTAAAAPLTAASR